MGGVQIEDTQDLPMSLTEGRSLLALRRMHAALAPFSRQDANAPWRPRRLRFLAGPLSSVSRASGRLIEDTQDLPMSPTEGRSSLALRNHPTAPMDAAPAVVC